MANLENKVVTHMTLSTDMYVRNNPPYIYAKQYDANSRYLVVRIMDSNKDFPVTGIAQLNATKPDGTHSYIEGETNADGTVTIGLTSKLLAVEGKISCDITVFASSAKDRALLTTSTFFIIVDKSNYDADAIESSNEFSTVSSALLQMSEDRAAAEAACRAAIDASEHAQEALSTKADRLALNGTALQLMSGATPLGEAIELPSGGELSLPAPTIVLNGTTLTIRHDAHAEIVSVYKNGERLTDVVGNGSTIQTFIIPASTWEDGLYTISSKVSAPGYLESPFSNTLIFVVGAINTSMFNDFLLEIDTLIGQGDNQGGASYVCDAN